MNDQMDSNETLRELDNTMAKVLGMKKRDEYETVDVNSGPRHGQKNHSHSHGGKQCNHDHGKKNTGNLDLFDSNGNGSEERSSHGHGDNHGSDEQAEEEVDDRPEVGMTVMQGSFQPAICLIELGHIDPNSFIIDYSTGARIVHYTGHFGKVKVLKTLVNKYQANPKVVDFYSLTVAHYAARSGEVSILLYFKNQQDLLNSQDQFGYTPIHYTALYNRTNAYVYLYHQLGLRLVPNLVEQTLQNMTHQFNCVELLQIMMQTKEFSYDLMQTVLRASITSQNFLVFKFIISNFYRGYNQVQWKEIQESIQRLDIHAANFQEITNKYLIRQELEGENTSKTPIPTNGFYIRQLLKFTWRRMAVFLGSLFIIFSHLFFSIASISSRNLNVPAELTKSDFAKVDPFLIVMIVGNVLTLFSLLTFLISEPGYAPKLTSRDRENILDKVCEQAEKNPKDNTVADQACYNCLIHRKWHVEHCKKCDRCVMGFQFHSFFFNKCIGQNNSRSYALFSLFSYCLFVLYIVQMTFLSTEYKQTEASNFFLKFIEIHIMFLLNLDFSHMIPLFLAEICLLGLLDAFVYLFVAISKEMTVNELNKPWEYKYNLEKRTLMKGERKPVFQQKFQPLCENIANVVKFFIGFKLPTGPKPNSKKSKQQPHDHSGNNHSHGHGHGHGSHQKAAPKVIDSKKGKDKESYIELSDLNTTKNDSVVASEMDESVEHL